MPTILQWVQRLEAKIEDQRRYAEPFEVRYRNQRVLPFIQREYAEVYGNGAVEQLSSGMRAPRSGTAAVVVDALADRLTVLGAASEDATAVRTVQAAWEANDLDVMHREAHREALIKARAFGQVSRAASGDGAIVGIDAAEQMAVHREPGPPYDVDAALKVWTDEWTGRRKARLWLPGWDIDLAEGEVTHDDPEGSKVRSRWVAEPEKASGLPVVPVVEFPCRPRLLAEPISEIEPIDTLVDLVDLIDGLMVFAGHFGAVPIRWVTGLTIPRDPADKTKPLLGADGKPLLGFNPRADHLWADTNPEAKFGQLTPAALDSFVKWAEHASSRIRAKTGVASTYFSLDLRSHMSAELLKTDEAPMVRKVRSIGERGSFGQAWRRLQQLILMIEDPSSRALVRPRWESAATRVEAQDADVFVKVAPHLGAVTAATEVLGWSLDKAQQGAAEARAALAEASDPIGVTLRKPLFSSVDGN